MASSTLDPAAPFDAMLSPMLHNVEEDEPPKRRTPSQHARLASLDVVRGFTITLMIFVDDVGDAYPTINHSPWNGVTLADIVMPWFLFMVGASMSMSLRKYLRGGRADRIVGTKACMLRALKLFFLGVLLQGGGWFDGYTYGFNLATMRWCGILNRIGWAYAITSALELWLPERPAPRGRSAHASVFTAHASKWCFALLFVLLHLALLLLTWVPSWTSHYGPIGDSSSELLPAEARPTIECDVRGAFKTPECSAIGYYDRLIFGQDHLGVWMSARLPQCTSCYPGNPKKLFRPDCHWCTGANMSGCPAEPPVWCFAHMYDPEGALATVPTVASAWIGVHFGRCLKHDGLQGRPVQIMLHWLGFAAALVAAGVALSYVWLPMNKQAWTPSYLMFMAGTCGAALLASYAILDADLAPLASGTRGGKVRACARKLCAPLEYMGMNSILVFFWHGTASALINAFYWAPPAVGGGYQWEPREGALCDDKGVIYHKLLSAVIADAAVRQLVYVLLKIACFMIGTWICFKQGYFWKI